MVLTGMATRWGLALLALALVACEAEGGAPGSDVLGGGEPAEIREVTASEAHALIEANEELIILDVSPYFAQGHIPGARNYPVGAGTLDAAIPGLDPARPYLVYCHADGPAVEGAQKLVDAGFTTVYRLLGNYGAWVEAGYGFGLPDAVAVDVDAAQAHALIAENPELIIIDVSPAYAAGHLPGAVNYPIGDGSLDEALPGLDPEAAYLVYCHSDAMTSLGVQKLLEAGFSTVYRLLGNYGAWVAAGYEVATGTGEIREISAAEAYQLAMDEPDLVIIDVSPIYEQGHLPGALSLPVGDGSLEAAIPGLDPQSTYLVYCHSDAPAIAGAQMLIDAGFPTVYRLLGNYDAWVAAGYPVETGAAPR